jgi:tellurite resistance protein TerC
VWIGTVAGVAILLALDLFVFHRRAHDVKFREAALFSALWLAVGAGFVGVVRAYGGAADAAAYVTGFGVDRRASCRRRGG